MELYMKKKTLKLVASMYLLHFVIFPAILNILSFNLVRRNVLSILVRYHLHIQKHNYLNREVILKLLN